MNDIVMIPTSYITLQRVTHATQGAISDRLAVNLSHAELESYRDLMLCQMIYRLSVDVMAEKLLEDEQEIPFRRVVPAPPIRVTPRHRYAWWLALALAGLMGLLSPLLTLWMAAAAVAMALIGVIALCEPEASVEQEEEIEVRGHVTVKASYFASFPEDTRVYPPDMGSMVRMVMLDEMEVG